MKYNFQLILNLFIALSLLNISSVNAQKTAKINVYSDPEAQIFVNGFPAGYGDAVIKIAPSTCLKIDAKLNGKYAKTVEFCNYGIVKLPKSFNIELKPDDAFAATIATNLANVDIAIRPKKTQAEVWKQINSLVLQYIDAIEISDKENMYLRTAWVSQSFNSGLIRTRIIIKTQGDQQFAVKLVSEKAEPGSRVTDDEKFISIDRVLSKYAKIIDEFQSRL